MFHGFDFDGTMLRVGSMNMLLHGIENLDIQYRDSLAQDHADEVEKYTLVLADPPFAGSLDYDNNAKDALPTKGLRPRASDKPSDYTLSRQQTERDATRCRYPFWPAITRLSATPADEIGMHGKEKVYGSIP